MVEKHIAVIADPYVSSFYRMAGLYSFNAHNVEDAKGVLNELVAREDIGVVLVSAEYYEKLEREFLEGIRKKRPDLVISVLPTLREKGKPMDVQQELLRALGMG